MSGVLRAVQMLVVVSERDRVAKILSVVPAKRAPMLEPWWQWTAYFAVAIASCNLARQRFG
jgi:hypothetical protein